MSKIKKYQKEFNDKKDALVEKYGNDITAELINRYYPTQHKMEMKEEDCAHFYSEEYSEESKELARDFFPAENADFEKYERLLVSGKL